jgi:ABC-type sulfate transport system permease subunit
MALFRKLLAVLAVSQLLTLYLTPVIYIYLDRFEAGSARVFAKLRPRRHGAGSAAREARAAGPARGPSR